MRLYVCPYVSEYVRIFGDFYEGDMDPVRGLLPIGTLTKKFSLQLLGPEKKHALSGISGEHGHRPGPFFGPFSDPLFSTFLHFF